jgi:(R,R)-butanediol dehydrogenase / meso-butanediol dehydrogenase / diacetyl reductase
MLALTWAGERAVETVDVAPPEATDGWALVAMAYTGLCGTDLHICAGEHPRAKPGLVIGHEVVGKLVSGVGDMAAGTPVFVNPLLPCGTCRSCGHGHPNVCERIGLLGIDRDGGAAELFVAPSAHLVALPLALDLRSAGLVEPAAVAVHAVRRAALTSGQRVHIVGAGPIGLLVASCARLESPSGLTISEPSAERASVAAALGFDLLDVGAPDHSADVVFDCTGHPAVAASVLAWAGTGGTVVTVGAYPGVVGVDLQDLMFRELAIVGTRTYTPDDVGTAVTLMERGAIDASRLTTAVMPLADGPRAIEQLRAGRAVKVLLEGPAA